MHFANLGLNARHTLLARGSFVGGMGISQPMGIFRWAENVAGLAVVS